MIGIKVVNNSNNLKIAVIQTWTERMCNESCNKDHRVFMMTCIYALCLGGKWKVSKIL